MKIERATLTPLVIPGLAEAVAEENEQRDMAFLALGDTSGVFDETIAGVKVKALTMRHQMWLELAGSKFVLGGIITPTEIIPEVTKILRIIGIPPKRKKGQHKLTPAQQNEAIIQGMWKERADEVMRDVQNYFRQAYADAPGGGAGGKKYYSGAAGLCLFMGKHFNMPPANALDLPLKVIFQFFKAAKMFQDPKAILFNQSDALVSEYLMKLDRKN